MQRRIPVRVTLIGWECATAEGGLVQSGFAEEEERAKIHSHFAQPDYLDPDV